MKRLISILFITLIFCACEKSDVDRVKPDLTDFEKFSNDDLAMFRSNEKGGLIKKDGTPMPFWARLGNDRPDGMPVTEDYGIIYFYTQDPSNVPGDFNLRMFFDPRATAFPFAVEGSAWIQQPFNPPQFPYMSKLKGLGEVHVWILTIEQVNEVNSDGEIYMDELNALDPPLAKGIATDFLENLYPSGNGGAPNPGILVQAQGYIEEGNEQDIIAGRRFIFHLQTKTTVDSQIIRTSAKLKLF